MRSIRRYQFFRHASDAALDQMRRLADLVIAAVLIVITFPLMLAVAVAIKWEGPGRIFERHTCIGRGGLRFQLLKFRTMALDPDHTMPAWARKPTRIGEFLRYTRIENLPQLYNLLRGDISLIDPDGSSPSFLE
jgi:lipopolysaccharide/colanic/teichoic acid biosynthesis glycosyltransferase